VAIKLHVHGLLVFADLTLTTDRLVELFQSVKSPDIGKLLGLPKSALGEFRRNYQSWARRKEAYLDTYAHHHPCPSWKRINEVLWRCGLDQQAEEVQNTYVEGMLDIRYIDL
jgi:hypothetical protein